jgi:Phosphodiester glycosidase
VDIAGPRSRRGYARGGQEPIESSRSSRSYERLRLRLPDGGETTLHIARFDLRTHTPRVVLLTEPLTLAAWCERHGCPDAIVGGFFVKPERIPLGELRIGGIKRLAVPFDPPWGPLRACVHAAGHSLRLARRPEIAAEPAGDLLQAGPLLVRGGASAIERGQDPEGFSAGAHQFDSDITHGRYPRAALGLTGTEAIAAVCDGRAPSEAGLSLAELAEAMLALGAGSAINLDGGGSASLVFGGRLVNRPREEHGLEIAGGRPIATALAFH